MITSVKSVPSAPNVYNAFIFKNRQKRVLFATQTKNELKTKILAILNTSFHDGLIYFTDEHTNPLIGYSGFYHALK